MFQLGEACGGFWNYGRCVEGLTCYYDDIVDKHYGVTIADKGGVCVTDVEEYREMLREQHGIKSPFAPNDGKHFPILKRT